MNRVRDRGSGGQVCKPYTPSRVTKVTNGMCVRFSPMQVYTLVVLSLQTGGKHSITQEASYNLFVHLRKKNTGKHYRNRHLSCRSEQKLVKPGGVLKCSELTSSLGTFDVLVRNMLMTVRSISIYMHFSKDLQ